MGHNIPFPFRWILSSRFENMEIYTYSHRLENAWPRILKCWMIRILTMNTCTKSSITCEQKALIPTSLNSSRLTNSICEIRVGLFKKCNFYSKWTFNILPFKIVGDSWSISFWFSKILWDPCAFYCSFISKISLYLLSKRLRPLSFDPVNLASLLSSLLFFWEVLHPQHFHNNKL